MIFKIIQRNILILASQWRRLAAIVGLDLILLGGLLVDRTSVGELLQGDLAIDFKQSALSFPLFWYWSLVWPIFLCRSLIAEVFSTTLNSVILKVQHRTAYLMGQMLTIIGLIVIVDTSTLVLLSAIQMKFNWALIVMLVAGSCLVALVWFLVSLWSVPVLGLALALLFPIVGLASEIPWQPTEMTMYIRVTEAGIPPLTLISYFIIYFLGIYTLTWFRFRRMDLLGVRGAES